jgi:RNA polymerase sigma factor (sigma-70 family)
MIRIVLADDHPIVIDGLSQVLRLERDMEVVARATTAETAVAAVGVHEPHVLLLDLAMPERDGLWVLGTLRERKSATRVILLTAHADAEAFAQARRLGAAAIVLKEMESSHLMECIRAVAAGQPWSGQRLVDERMTQLGRGASEAATLMAQLTPREGEVVRMTAAGLRNQDIATRLGISEGTVKQHLHKVYDKLGVNGRPELIRLATRLRIG